MKHETIARPHHYLISSSSYNIISSHNQLSTDFITTPVSSRRSRGNGRRNKHFSKIEEVEAIVDQEKSKVEEEPPNENERSNNREENTNNITSIEVPAANNLTTDKTEIAILYEDVVNPNMPP